ncbi:MAG: DUF1801 domain-containing protein [Bacteroidetes bacterium]|nr:DUF1801 domain-containing protein [Bacteroidota bacterium]
MLKSNSKLLYKNIDAYLEAQPAWMQEALQRLRKVIIETAPKAEEHISYNMPTFKYYGALVYFAAFKNHCSFFPGGGNIMEIFKEELKDFITSKGTIQFTQEKQIPKKLIQRIVKERIKQNEERQALKNKKTK